MELRFFGGLDIEEAARALGISVATANRDWVMAKAWLYRRLQVAGLTAALGGGPLRLAPGGAALQVLLVLGDAVADPADLLGGHAPGRGSGHDGRLFGLDGDRRFDREERASETSRQRASWLTASDCLRFWADSILDAAAAARGGGFLRSGDAPPASSGNPEEASCASA